MKVSCASCHTLYAPDDGDAGDLEAVCGPRSGVRAATCTQCREPSLRSLAPTLPRGAAPDFRPEPRIDEPQLDADEPAPGSEDLPPRSQTRNRRRDWCVDHGSRLATMTTFELWISIASGEVNGDVLVWREGMECWTAVRVLPELACALRIEDPAAIETGWERTEDVAPTDRVSAPALARLEEEEARGVTPDAEGTIILRTARRPALASARREPRPRRMPSRGARAVAAGAAAALLAIAVAAFASGERPGRAGAQRTEPYVSEVVQQIATTAAESLGGDVAIAHDPPVARRGDPGQVRRRRSQQAPRHAAE